MIRRPDDLPDDQFDIWQQAAEYFQQAYRFQREGDWAAAISGYKSSLKLFPTAEAFTFLGWVYSFLHLYDLAIEACQKAIQVDPDFGNPYNDIGGYLIELEQFHDAIPWLEQALNAKYYTARHLPHFNLGRVYEEIGEWILAVDAYQNALEIAPDHHEARRSLHALRTRFN